MKSRSWRAFQGLVAHDDGIDDAELVEGELVLAEDAHLLRALDRPAVLLQFPGEHLHECGLPASIRPSEAIAAPRGERRGHILEKDLRAKAHRHILNRQHSRLPNRIF
jgi:hypothetical protein